MFQFIHSLAHVLRSLHAVSYARHIYLLILQAVMQQSQPHCVQPVSKPISQLPVLCFVGGRYQDQCPLDG